ncbi:MAG: hypothetical protein K6G03_08990 [Lachnospiraceae bacterium]|nr:hypothetical protein [Lachnospiraceae bacterium]
MDIDLADFSSDYISYNGEMWSIADGEIGDEGVTLVSSQDILLKAGSYTVYVDYMTNEIQQFSISSAESEAFLYANPFILSKNKVHEKYDFYLKKDINDINMSIYDYKRGNLSLSGVSVKSNTNNLKVLLFLIIFFSIVIDMLLFNERIRNKRLLISELILVALIPSITLFIDGISIGHDLGFHLARIEGIAESLKQRVFPVKMLPFFNDDCGYPTGVFYGDLLLYIPALLRIAGFTVSTAYKIYIFLINVLTTFSAYICCKKILNDHNTALVATIAYVTASYRMMCMFVRSAVGEYTAMAFIPVVFLAVWNIYHEDIKAKEYSRNSITLALGMVALLYTHLLSVEMAVLVLAIFVIVFWKKTIRLKTLMVYINAIGLSLILGSGFIVPFIDYYNNVTTVIKYKTSKEPLFIQGYGAYLSDYFAFFKKIFGGGSTIVNERFQVTPGLILMGGLILSVYFIIKYKNDKDMSTLCIVSILLLFISSDLFPWDFIALAGKPGSFLTQIQFPWRYIAFAMVFLMILTGLAIKKGISVGVWSNKIYLVVVAIAIIYSCFSVGQIEDMAEIGRYIDRAEMPKYTSNFYNEPTISLNANEYLIADTDRDDLNYCMYPINAQAAVVEEAGVDMILAVQTDGDAMIGIPRFNYPNYVIKTEDGDICKTENGFNNSISIVLPDAYTGLIYVNYVEPWYWRLSEAISVTGVIAVCVYCFRMNKRKRLAEE